MKTAVIGLGKLGLPYAAVANSRHDVIGVDTNEELLSRIRNNTNFPEPYLNDYLAMHPLKVTSNLDNIKDVEMVFIFTNTEAGDFYSPTSVLSVLKELKPHIKDKVVIIISTLEPGIFRKVILPFLNEKGIVCNGLCYNPIMVAIGEAVTYFRHPPFVLLGATNEEARVKSVQFYRELLGEEVPIFQGTIENIEIAKYALNFTLINRISMINFLAEYCDKYNGDIDFLVEVLKKEERVTGKKMLRAGLGFGGPCFPMDARAFKKSCVKEQIDPCLLDSIMCINNRVADRIIDIITSKPQRKVSVLGVTYKPGTPYTIESQALDIVRRLSTGKDVMIYDPQGMENARKELGSIVRYASSFREALEWGDIILVAVPWKEFEGTEHELKKHQFLVDPWALYKGRTSEADHISPGRTTEARFLVEPDVNGKIVKRSSEADEKYIKKESGGRTKIILVTRVHKEATDERMCKLVDEIKFLESIPDEWRIHFPQVVLSYMSNDKVYYEMPHYALPTMRRLLFSGILKHQEALKWIDRVVEFSFQMCRKEIIPMPDNYMDYMHFRRLKRRLGELYRKTEVFKKIISQKTLIINGVEYKNIPLVLKELERPEVVRRVLPEFISKWGHSDLHFSNVLIDLEHDNFILIDPRGYPFCDYYYDYGKLWHSVNGKYEFVAENMFKLNGIDFELEKNDVYWECEKIKKKLPDILCKYSSEPREVVIMKTEFNEAVHFASLVPFILDFDGKEERAVVGYYIGVIILNQFLQKYF